ncbi:MAG TPA: response regulator [Blastocatellia bacterium]|nr:response regulator [Blastocatellia bacterium]
MNDGTALVLCVEDDLDTQDLLRVVLQDRGCRFEAVGSCADALVSIRGKDISVLLLDNQLPDGSGIELCQQVRQIDVDIPIIFLSGSAHDDERETALKIGANAFLTKPFELDDLFTTLANYINIQAP